jgi:hypothetical protein
MTFTTAESLDLAILSIFSRIETFSGASSDKKGFLGW